MTAKILVVEDDEDLRYLYATALRLSGFDATSVRDGVDALVHVEQDPPDLLLLDLSLPTLGGESVARELASNAATRRIPIVIVTGQRLLAPPAGAAAVLTKPINIDELFEVVRDCLQQASGKARAPAEPPRSTRRPARR